MRLDDIYRYQFYREGVIAEIAKLAATEQPEKSTSMEIPLDITIKLPESKTIDKSSEKADHRGGSGVEDDGDSSDDDNEDENDNDDLQDDASVSPSSRGSTMSLDGAPRHTPSDITTMQQVIAQRAKKFLDVHENEKNSKIMKNKAMKILSSLQSLAADIESHYLHHGLGHGLSLFTSLASYFDGDVLESVTSAELLHSEVVRVLLDVFNNPDERMSNDARSTFLEAFMGRTVTKNAKSSTANSPATPFSILINKLQDLLSRSEHFEVITVHQNTFDGNRSSAASMLAKQIRLKLVADEDSDIPRAYRNIMVSIHAIATFKALDDYLRPRIVMSERPPRTSRHRDGLSGALAALAAAGMPNPYAGVPSAQARLAERGLASASAATPSAPNPSSSRARKAKSKSQTALTTTPASVGQSTSSTPQEKISTRRSSRRNQAQTEPSAPPPLQEEDSLTRALECADEKQLTDDEGKLNLTLNSCFRPKNREVRSWLRNGTHVCPVLFAS